MKLFIMNILFIGDVCGEPGRKTIAKILPKLRKEKEIDLVIANAENVAHGRGVTRKTADELFSLGIDFLTSGDHVFNVESFLDDLDDSDLPLIRPANYPDDIPGRGYDLIDLGAKGQVLIINLQGLSFMHENLVICPFRKIDEILNKTETLNPTAIIVDFHGEATADKIAFGHYVDGRVSAVIGTHTHVPTADARILEKGTGFVTDAGMVGPLNSVLWVKKDIAIRFQKYPYRTRFEIEESGPMVFNSVLFEIEKGKAVSIERVDHII